jgi:hypothetical protein
VSSGDNAKLEGMPELEGATLALEGYASGELVSFGRSEAIDLRRGEATVQLLVAEVDGFAWLERLTDDNFQGAVAPDGAGSFYLFGGSGSSALIGSNDAQDGVWVLDVAPPDALRFEKVGSMPDLADDAGTPGRMGHTATLLTGSHGHQGKILVAGGTNAYQDCQYASASAFLWNPETDEAESLGSSDPMVNRHFMHSAVEDSGGSVVLAGGFTYTSTENSILWSQSIEIFNPSSGSFAKASGTASGPLLHHGSARLGTEGVLHCGGVDLTVSLDVKGSVACDLVTVSGNVQSAESLPERLVGPAMAPLPDGRVLVTGGLAVGTEDEGLSYDVNATTDATDEAWITDGSSWEAVGGMVYPRAFHQALPLPDGRVLLVGGATSGDLLYLIDMDALDCAEIFDPDSGTFSEVGSCNSNPPLPNTVVLPAVASDPDYGVLVVGGQDGVWNPVDGAALFVGAPDL